MWYTVAVVFHSGVIRFILLFSTFFYIKIFTAAHFVFYFLLYFEIYTKYFYLSNKKIGYCSRLSEEVRNRLKFVLKIQDGDLTWQDGVVFFTSKRVFFDILSR